MNRLGNREILKGYSNTIKYDVQSDQGKCRFNGGSLVLYALAYGATAVYGKVGQNLLSFNIPGIYSVNQVVNTAGRSSGASHGAATSL